MKIRWSHDRFIFIIRISIARKVVFISRRDTRSDNLPVNRWILGVPEDTGLHMCRSPRRKPATYRQLSVRYYVAKEHFQKAIILFVTDHVLKFFQVTWSVLVENGIGRETSSSELMKRPVAQIPQCTLPISHNAPFCNRNVHTCAHLCYKMVHCGICEMVYLTLESLKHDSYNTSQE